VIIEIFALALASTVRPTSVAAVYALLSHEEPRRLMAAYIAAGLAFTLAFGAIVVGATSGIHVQSGTGKAIADIAGGSLALAFGIAVLTGLIQGRRSGDAPEGRLKTALDRRLTIRTATLAGPATHIPGLFYVIALNAIIAHDASVTGEVSALVVYNLVWFALPILALAICVTDPTAARQLVSVVKQWTHDHAREILLVASFSVGTALVTRGALGL
jgi:Sap, sulfolipid-1-addressing protein